MTEEHPDASTAPQPPPEVGEAAYPSLEHLAALLPQYEMHGILGVGGMGAVYKARQPALDRWVAIKVLPASASQNQEDAHRFIKEARAMAKLVHPHIVAVFDFGQTYEGHLYLVMEYVEGRDLHERTRAGQITPKRAREVMAQLCDALQFAHDHGVAHRDIKPANILITDQWKVKVADFGLARELAAQANSDEPEYGTPDYTAPERLIIGAVVDHRADIYSLGVVIHEMLTGKTPSAAGADAGKGLPPEFAGVISKCLMHDPARRYQKAADVKVALLSAAADNQLTSRQAVAPPPRPSAIEEEEEEAEERSGSRLFGDAVGSGFGPIAWGLTAVVVAATLGWLVLKNKTQKWEEPMKAKTTSHAGQGDLAVFAPPKPAASDAPAPEPAPKVAPTPATPAPPVAEPPKSAAKVTQAAEPPAMAAQAEPAPGVPEGPFEVGEGPAGQAFRLNGHGASIYSVQIHPDQRRVVSSSYDGTVRVWDLKTRREILQSNPGIGSISYLSLRSDGKLALAVSYNTDRVAVVNVDTGSIEGVTGVPHDRLARSIFSPDGNGVLLGGTSTGQNLFRWSMNSDEAPVPVRDWRYTTYDLTPIGSGPEVLIVGAEVRQGSSPNSVTIVSTQMARFRLDTGSFDSLSLNGNLVSSVYPAHDAPLAVAFCSFSLGIVSWPDFGLIKEIKFVSNQPRPRNALLAKEGKYLAGTWSDYSLRIQEVASGEEVYQATTSSRLTDFALSHDGKWAALGSRELNTAPGTVSASPDDAYDVIIWRMPKWDALISEKDRLAQAEAQLGAGLAAIDPELAKLQEQLSGTAAPTAAQITADVQTLNGQYIAALRREAGSSAPTEQRILFAEADLVASGGTLPPEGVDLAAPPVLGKLRAIYRKQMAALMQKEDAARAEATRLIQENLVPLRDRRQQAGDQMGAARATALIRRLVPETPASSVASVGNGGTGPVAAGTAVKRPDRPCTVVTLPRIASNTMSPGTPAVSQIPGDLGKVVAITGGKDHVFALTANGAVRGWGNWEGQTVTVPSSATDVVAIDSTSSTALALRTDGRVVVWSPGDSGQVWSPPPGKAVSEICAGENGQGCVLFTDGTARLTISDGPSLPRQTWPATHLFYLPSGGFGTIRTDGTPAYAGVSILPIAPLPGNLRGIAALSFCQRYAVALQTDGTLTGWGELSPDQRFRTRKFTPPLTLPHDYADRLFPVHRSDHSWELVPNPNVPAYLSEDRISVLEGKLRGCLDAVFTQYCVIGIRQS